MKKVNTKSVISIIGEIIGTAHSPLKIISDDFNEYYLKAPKKQTSDFSIINEFFVSALLNCWELKTPEIAALVINIEEFNKKLSTYHNASNFNNTCFGSKVIPVNYEFCLIEDIANKRDFNKFSNPTDILKIGLFDIWVENDDRKPTNPNLLLANEENGIEFYAIDHAYTFSSIKFTDLNPEFEPACSFNDSILNTDISKSVFKYIKKDNSKWFDEIRNYFYFSIEECKNNFGSIIENIPSDLGFNEKSQTAIYNFLFSGSRNKKVFCEFLRRFDL